MTLASLIEFIHSLLIILLVILIPFLFFSKWRKLQIFSAIYCAIFIVGNRLSQWFLGECWLTRLARYAGGVWDGQLFIVKFSRGVFNCIPTNKQIIYLEQAMFLIVCLGIGVSV